jgi:hypothetical protein
MHNRRCNIDDWRGVDEALSENDNRGNSIAVPATYYVQLFNKTIDQSLQRTLQQRQDSPMEQFFAFNAEVTAPGSVSPLLVDGLDTLLMSCGFTSEMKLEMFTMGRNSILMRVENIGDIYDSANSEVVY